MLPNMVLCRIPDCGTDGLFRSCENSSPEPRGPKRLRMETSSLQAKVYNTEIKSQSSIYDAWREYGKCIISSELCLHLPIVYAFYMSTRYSARGLEGHIQLNLQAHFQHFPPRQKQSIRKRVSIHR